MSYLAFYQKQYRKENKDRIKQLKKNLYNSYKSEYLPCVFCNKIIQLNACNTHLNTRNCIEIQNTIDNYSQLLIEHKRRVNELRARIREEELNEKERIKGRNRRKV